jgi:predicted phage tail protein
VHAQDTDLQLTINVVDASSRVAEDGAIQIEVHSSGSNFTYMLYDKEPWNGGKKLDADTESGETYSFMDLKSGNYYVCVQNKDEVTKCANVSIKPKK